jgi:hypothetical protein
MWVGQPNRGQDHLKVSTATTVPPMSVPFIKASVHIAGRALPRGNMCITPTWPAASTPSWGTYLGQQDSQRQITIAMKNCSPVNLELQRNYFIGCIENVQECKAQEICPAYLSSEKPTGPNKNLVLKKDNSLWTP